MTDERRALDAMDKLYTAAAALGAAEDVALRHVGRELEQIVADVDDWFTDGDLVMEDPCDVCTLDAWC